MSEQEQQQKREKPGRIKKVFKYIGLGFLILLILMALAVEAPKKVIIILLIILAAFTALPRKYRKWFWLTAGRAVLILINHIKKVSKWIGLSVLILLILMALAVEAPKKVVILLLIILAACTILPRRYRKWFWLTAGSVVLILIIWIFLPEDNRSWRPYTFDKELATLETKYKIPDEENAAFAYYEIFDNLDIDTNQPDFFIKSYLSPSSRDAPWLSRDHPETADWLKGHQDTIEKLIETTQKEKCMFPLIADLTKESENMQSLRKFIHCISLLLSSGNNDAAEGRIDNAIEKYLCVKRISYHQHQQPTTVSDVVYGIERLALNPLNRLIIDNKLTEKQTQRILNSIPSITNDWSSEFMELFELEKLSVKNIFGILVYEVNTKGDIRLSRLPLPVLKIFHIDTSKLTWWHKRFYKAQTIYGWFLMPSSPQKVSEIIDLEAKKCLSMAEQDYDWTNKLDKIVSRIDILQLRLKFRAFTQLIPDVLGQSFYHAHNVYIRTLTLRRGTYLLIAIKQYKDENGTWPDSLEEIKNAAPAEAFIDPVTGKQLQYENHGENFSLYGEEIKVWSR